MTENFDQNNANDEISSVKNTSTSSSIDDELLRKIVNDICDSGELGRSKVYGKLLHYLAESSINQTAPKELDIAVDVLERDTSFDVSKDSAVRVSVHQLRKRMDAYYEKFPNAHPYRIDIPKGQYNIELVGIKPNTEQSVDDNQGLSASPVVNQKTSSWFQSPLLLLALVILLIANGILFFTSLASKKNVTSSQQIAAQAFWPTVLLTQKPVLIVVGDYYIFGEQDDAGNVSRMVREFAINSADDLERLFTEEPQLAWRYRDLDLSYIPEGTALAMNAILPIVYANDRAESVTMKMMSELTTQDLQSSHIIYLGYISGLNRLSRMVFSASGLEIGANYDELIDKQTGKRFVSDAGLPSENRPFVGYGFVSSVPITQDNRLIVIAGMRDAGLSEMAKLLSDQQSLEKMNQTLFDVNDSQNGFESLYEVRGMDRMNFSTRAVYENTLNSRAIWQENSVVTE